MQIDNQIILGMYLANTRRRRGIKIDLFSHSNFVCTIGLHIVHVVRRLCEPNRRRTCMHNTRTKLRHWPSDNNWILIRVFIVCRREFFFFFEPNKIQLLLYGGHIVYDRPTCRRPQWSEFVGIVNAKQINKRTSEIYIGLNSYFCRCLYKSVFLFRRVVAGRIKLI